ncbi:MAG TPA: acyl-CoA carboxylase epsilon subunit [Actinotalea sp.]
MNADVRGVRGEPDDTALAALVAGLAAGAARGQADAHGDDLPRRREAAAHHRWRDAVHRLTDELAPGPDAWRWSRRP